MAGQTETSDSDKESEERTRHYISLCAWRRWEAAYLTCGRLPPDKRYAQFVRDISMGYTKVPREVQRRYDFFDRERGLLADETPSAYFAALDRAGLPYPEWLPGALAKRTIAKKAPRRNAGEGLGAKERESLLKLVIGMACAGYGYDPKALRSEKPPEIASDLLQLGLTLSEDTVRKYLREAAELLPPSDQNR